MGEGDIIVTTSTLFLQRLHEYDTQSMSNRKNGDDQISKLRTPVSGISSTQWSAHPTPSLCDAGKLNPGTPAGKASTPLFEGRPQPGPGVYKSFRDSPSVARMSLASSTVL